MLVMSAFGMTCIMNMHYVKVVSLNLARWERQWIPSESYCNGRVPCGTESDVTDDRVPMWGVSGRIVCHVGPKAIHKRCKP